MVENGKQREEKKGLRLLKTRKANREPEEQLGTKTSNSNVEVKKVNNEILLIGPISHSFNFFKCILKR